MLTVYKASAGSGKTFQLVAEYIKLLLDNPLNYRHILAVTFTNKATNEMKSRILEQLYRMAKQEDSEFLEHLQRETEKSSEFLCDRAKIVLKNILHDYNRFSVTTIDSFTQRTIKAFNRELGISPNFTLELDSEIILAEATDRLLEKIDKDKNLLKWLADFSREKIEDNKSQRIESDIKTLGSELFRENFQLFFPENSDSVYNREKLKQFSKELKKIKAGFENSLKTMGESGMILIRNNGLEISDFAFGATGVANFIKKIAEGEIKEAGSRVLEAADYTEKWYVKKSEKKDAIHSIAENHLRPLLNEILEYFRNNEIRYFTSVQILKELRVLGILTDLKEEIKSLLHEKSILQISDSNLLLSKIIGNSDSPFIYEKTGTFYRHFMLDEFQDTSGLQWNNFKPLVSNSLAEGNNNLLVGDVKQSIYRWRNSDWEILSEKIHNDFRAGQIEEKILEQNWRSDLNIIKFNNLFFETLKRAFESFQFSDFENLSEPAIDKFRKVYSSISQIPGKNKNFDNGLVKVQLFDDENFKENSVKQLVQQVKELQDKGIQASETAILIRNNKDGKEILEQFFEHASLPENAAYNLSVVSNESFLLSASQPVLFIINVVQLVVDPENLVAKAALLTLWNQWLLPKLRQRNSPEYPSGEISSETSVFNANAEFEQSILPEKMEMVREKILLSSIDESLTRIASVFGLFDIEAGLPFIQTLIDKAGELKTTLSNDLSNFLFWWNEKGYKTSVSVNEELDAIRLLTVHKSKGLEFKAVLIPFFDWDTTSRGNRSGILWCRPSPPFDALPLIPVKSGSSLLKTIFREDYLNEKLSYYIDVFNLVYVAFTRAKSVLVVHSKSVDDSKKPTDSAKSIPFLLNWTLKQLSDESGFEMAFDENAGLFQSGHLIQVQKTPNEQNSVFLKKYSFNDFEERLKLRLSGDDFLIQNQKMESVKNTGKIIHEILAAIQTEKDMEEACKTAFRKGLISATEQNQISNFMKESVKNPQISSWFDGSYTVLNERDLLSKEKLLRPDRIMLKGDSALVVDFKTGEIKTEKYHWQVKQYARILKDTGFNKVEGFIWYTGLNEVEKICEF